MVDTMLTHRLTYKYRTNNKEKSMKNLVNAIYLRLYRKGYNAIKDEIENYITAHYKDVDSISEEDKKNITQFFINNLEIANTGAKVEAEIEENSNNQIVPTVTPALMPEYQPVNNLNAITKTEATNLVVSQVEIFQLDIKMSDVSAISQDLYNRRLDLAEASLIVSELIRNYVSDIENELISILEQEHNKTVQHINASYNRRNRAAKQYMDKLKEDLSVSNRAYKSDCEQFVSDAKTYFESIKIR